MPALVLPDQTTIEYTVRTNRLSKYLRLSVYRDGRILVTKPRSLSLRRAQDFIQARAEWLRAKLFHLEQLPVLGRADKADYLSRRAAAQILAIERLQHFNQFYHFTYRRISIRNQGTRWGSCSRRGSLNFNYRILDLAPDLQDYLIVHELCHLQEFNHSTAFWQLVAQTIPDYLAKRSVLRRLRL
jgi:hypothetical protein